VTSRRTGAPAAHAIVAVLVTVATVGAGSWLGLLDRDKLPPGDASAFEFGVADSAAPVVPVSDSVNGSEDEFTPEVTVAPSVPGVEPTTAPTTLETAPTVAAAIPNRKPTKDDPLRVYIAGDSDAGTMGPPLQRELQNTGLVESELSYKAATGLSRPDEYNWPKRLQEDIAKYNPEVVVVTFGGNDAQSIEIDGVPRAVDTPEWRAEYGGRVGAVMDFLTADGRKLIWVGIPNAKTEGFRARLQILEEVTRAEAAKRPGVVYVDVWNMFVGLSGGYADFIIDKRDGQGKQVRQDDGFHLNSTGAEILALNVAEEVRINMRERGAQV
jgi:uncharacterized protein